MATWTNIPDSVLEPGKPARSVDALALRDNPIAIAEGAAGAPRIQTNAIQNGAVTNAKIANMNAGKLNSGTVPGARLPTTYGTVGSYLLAGIRPTNSLTVASGATVAGSRLGAFAFRVGGGGGFDSPTVGAAMSGTWRNVSGDVVRPSSVSTAYPTGVGLFVRIS